MRVAGRSETMAAGAERLKAAIDKTLTSGEKEALGERIAFLRDMAALSLDKVGLVSDAEGEEAIQQELWMKSIAVSYGLFAGREQGDIIKASGLKLLEGSVQARDFITACAVHYDTIFGDG